MSRPAGAIRGKALAAGVPLPPPGSFQDVVMQEVLFRERNKEYIKHVTLLSAVEILTQRVTDLLSLMTPLDDSDVARTARHTSIHEQFAKLMRITEDEVFEESYMPERIKAEEKASRLRRLKEIESKQRDAALTAKVQGYAQK